MAQQLRQRRPAGPALPAHPIGEQLIDQPNRRELPVWILVGGTDPHVPGNLSRHVHTRSRNSRTPIQLRVDLQHLLHNPATPHGHEGLWALGLQRGLDGDFASAASLVVPQIEHWVRVRLKERGSHTMVTDERGVETENGLGTLLDDPQASDAVGLPLLFELKALLTDQVGPNLRNEIAHGLVDDQALGSPAAVAAWWLALKVVMLPLAASFSSQQRDPDGGEAGDGEGLGTKPQ